MPDVLLRIADFGPQSPPVAVAPDVHPMPAPPLAVLRTVEQPLHHFLVCFRRLISQKRIELLQRRGQADQVERHAPQPDAFSGFGLPDERMSAVFGSKESVDRIALPTRGLR